MYTHQSSRPLRHGHKGSSVKLHIANPRCPQRWRRGTGVSHLHSLAGFGLTQDGVEPVLPLLSDYRACGGDLSADWSRPFGRLKPHTYSGSLSRVRPSLLPWFFLPWFSQSFPFFLGFLSLPADTRWLPADTRYPFSLNRNLTTPTRKRAQTGFEPATASCC